MRIIQAPRTWLSHFSPSHLLHTMLLCATLLCSTLSCKTVIALPAQADTAQVDFAAMLAATHEHVLENGLKVIVREDHRSPIVSFQIWYHVGASDEPHHLTGISHVLEHLMFKGTTALQPGEFSAWISELGGQENAFTARDQTVYYQTWGAHNLALSMALEADRMSHLLFSQEEFDKELQVVKEERRLRTEDNPNAKLYERFLRVAYQSSPYGQPVIGWMHDLDHITLKDAQNWYKSWYAPNNATIIIAGDVHAADVFSEAQRAFGNTPRHTLPKRNRPLEVEPLGEKRLIVKAPAQLPTLL
ncbi:MAG: pitrilysin family protein, partial [Gammaproteobacteria bacterium]